MPKDFISNVGSILTTATEINLAKATNFKVTLENFDVFRIYSP